MHAIAQLRLVDQAYDAILTAICTHELAPGERMTQEELADRLNVSRQPIQQTLLALEHEAILQAVIAGDPDDAERLARAHAEGVGAKLAALLESECGEAARAKAPA